MIEIKPQDGHMLIKNDTRNLGLQCLIYSSIIIRYAVSKKSFFHINNSISTKNDIIMFGRFQNFFQYSYVSIRGRVMLNHLNPTSIIAPSKAKSIFVIGLVAKITALKKTNFSALLH